MSEKWKVTCLSIWIRTLPSVSGTKIGCIYNGDEITVQKKNGNWFKHSKGWSCLYDSNGSQMMKKISSENPIKEKKPNPPVGNPEPYEIQPSGYKPNIAEYAMYDGGYNANPISTIDNALGVLGLPYQFLPSADRRLSGDSNPSAIGRVYANKIISKMPLLLILPGKARFMTKYSKKERKNALEQFVNVIRDEESSLENILKRDGKYYTLEADDNRYYNFVNPLCRIAARFLGVQDYKIDGTRLDRIRWEKITSERCHKITDIITKGYVSVYMDSEKQISESFGNDTTESKLAGMADGVTEMGREMKFLLGYGSSALGVNNKLTEVMNDSDINQNIENINNWANKMLGGKGNIINNLITNLGTVAQGGRLIFPEIWSSSNYSKSYDVSVKLVSPDCDPLSIYLNLIMPLMHFIAFVAPQSINSNPNGYCAPFLVRAVYKGMFTCDMGIITGMSITKGEEGAWTKEGIPTVINVNFSIKDLYEALSITEMKGNPLTTFDTINNTMLMDYIANSCGVNIYKPEISRNIDIWFTQNFVNRISDTVTKNIWGGVEQNIQNAAMNIYRHGSL